MIAGWPGARELVAALGSDPLTRESKLLLVVAEGADTAGAGSAERLAAPFSPLQLQVKLRRLLG